MVNVFVYVNAGRKNDLQARSRKEKSPPEPPQEGTAPKTWPPKNQHSRTEEFVGDGKEGTALKTWPPKGQLRTARLFAAGLL